MAQRSPDHSVNEKIPFGKMLVYGLQHVLAMYAGSVAVPLVISASLGLTPEQTIFLINADLFTCGIATLIQTIGFWKFGIRIPVIQGVTFVCVQPIIILGTSMVAGGLTTETALVVIFLSVIISGLFTVLIAPLFGRLIHLFPPVVTGTVIAAIGISLLPVAINMMGGQNDATATEPFGSPFFLMVSFLVVVTILVSNRFLKGFLKNISVLIGIAVGFIVCLIAGRIDFSKVMEAAPIGIDLPFGLNMPGLNNGEYFRILADAQFLGHLGPAVFSMILVMIIVMIASTGDYLAIGKVIDLDIDQEDVTRGLRADGLSTMLGGMFNSMPYTVFEQNIGLIVLTRVRSRWVVAASGVILMILGLLPKLAALFESMPGYIIGGAALVMFATVAIVGIQYLSKVDFVEKPNNVLIVAVSIAVGTIPILSTEFFGFAPGFLAPLTGSSISLAAICAVLLNLFFNGIKKTAIESTQL